MGTTSSFFGGGGGGAVILPAYTLLSSNSTWTPPHDGTAYVHVIGAGGTSHSNNGYSKAGAAAGGYCMKLITLSTSTDCNITIGLASTSSGGQGGTSSFADGTDTLTAYGGSWSTSGGTGGTASGGTYNRQGGRGGSVSGSYAGSLEQGGGGGGAVNITGTAYRGGDVIYNADTSSGVNAAGGAGIGGNGAGVGTSSTTINSSSGGGGGSGGPGFSSNRTNTNGSLSCQGGPASVAKPDGVVGLDFIKDWGVGGSFLDVYTSSYGSQGSWWSTPGTGGGGAGGRDYPYNYRSGQDGGLFGGGGAAGGNGGLGGGGGGAYYRDSNQGRSTFRGHGGAGVVFIEYIERS